MNILTIREAERKVAIPGPEGVLEGNVKLADRMQSPIALIFHPHPLHGGNMNNKVVYKIAQAFQKNNFHTLKINFRGVGDSQGESIGGLKELEDALAALDWFIKKFERRLTDSLPIWVAGFSFGGWIALQTAMRRPEVSGFVAVSPPVNQYPVNMLTPFPNGLIVQGDSDHVVPIDSSREFSTNLIQQKGCTVEFMSMSTDHYYNDKLDDLSLSIIDFVSRYQN